MNTKLNAITVLKSNLEIKNIEIECTNTSIYGTDAALSFDVYLKDTDTFIKRVEGYEIENFAGGYEPDPDDDEIREYCEDNNIEYTEDTSVWDLGDDAVEYFNQPWYDYVNYEYIDEIGEDVIKKAVLDDYYKYCCLNNVLYIQYIKFCPCRV